MRDSLTRAILEKDFPGKVTLTGMNAEDDKALVARLLKGEGSPGDAVLASPLRS